jgi:hypothetical protein
LPWDGYIQSISIWPSKSLPSPQLPSGYEALKFELPSQGSDGSNVSSGPGRTPCLFNKKYNELGVKPKSLKETYH